MSQDPQELLRVLEQRFAQNPGRHPGVSWSAVEAALRAQTGALASLAELETTGGEPDVVGQEGDAFVFVDCSAESPAGRRSLCYDRAAWEGRKEHKPAGNAVDWATRAGAALLTEAQTRELQQLGEFDLETSSWVLTPASIRDKGGALFCDRRYGQVFVYHNGAESYYSARAFRCRLVVKAR